MNCKGENEAAYADDAEEFADGGGYDEEHCHCRGKRDDCSLVG